MNVFNVVNIVPWNIRGAINAKEKRRIKELVQLYKPTIFILMETHCLFASAKVVLGQIRHLVEASSHSRGIWILVDNQSGLNTFDMYSFPQAITFGITRDA